MRKKKYFCAGEDNGITGSGINDYSFKDLALRGLIGSYLPVSGFINSTW